MRLTKETNLYRDHAVKNGVDDAAKVATNYLDYDQQTGLTLGYVGTSERAVIVPDGMEIYDGFNDQIAQFKSVTRLGLEDEGNLQIDYHSLQLKDLAGETYVHLSDSRGHDGYTEFTETFTGNGTRDYVYVDYGINSVISVTINGTETSDYTYNIGSRYLYFTTAPPSGSEIVVIYKSAVILRAYTFGTRNQNYRIGSDSFVNGYECVANGDYSHAEGKNSYAMAESSHAEGNGCIAQWTPSSPGAHAEGNQTKAHGNGAHSEGYNTDASSDYAHAEGYETEVIYDAAHAEGYQTKAYALYSHVEGCNTESHGKSQHVSGKYNVPVWSDSTIFIVGGGTSSTRKNAMTLSDGGNMVIAGTLTQSSDKRLKHHRAYLSDQQDQVNEFINRLKPAWFEKDEQKHLGFYAQDVQQTDRWQCMVDNDTNGYLTLGYTEIIAPLVAYCQNLEQKVETLEQRIARLEQLLNQ